MRELVLRGELGLGDVHPRVDLLGRLVAAADQRRRSVSSDGGAMKIRIASASCPRPGARPGPRSRAPPTRPPRFACRARSAGCHSCGRSTRRARESRPRRHDGRTRRRRGSGSRRRAPPPAADRGWSPTPIARARGRARAACGSACPYRPRGAGDHEDLPGQLGLAAEHRDELGALSRRQAADRLRRRDAAELQHLVDLYAPVFRHREQQVEDLR